MRRPRPIQAKLPGGREQPTSNERRPAKQPKIVGVVEAVADEAGHLAAMGHSAAKSAGHKAHDILHGIGL